MHDVQMMATKKILNVLYYQNTILLSKMLTKITCKMVGILKLF